MGLSQMWVLGLRRLYGKFAEQSDQKKPQILHFVQDDSGLVFRMTAF